MLQRRLKESLMVVTAAEVICWRKIMMKTCSSELNKRCLTTGPFKTRQVTDSTLLNHAFDVNHAEKIGVVQKIAMAESMRHSP